MEALSLYGNVALKLAVGMGFFLLILRTTGRGSLNQMTPLDLISNFVLGGIIGGVIYNPDISVMHVIIVLLIWQLLVVLVNFLRKHSIYIHRIVVGGDIALVIDGQFQMKEIQRLKIDVNDLVTMLRIKGCALHEVAYARFESNGDVSVIKKDEGKKTTLLVKNGVMIDGCLEEIGQTNTWLKHELKKKNLKIEDAYAVEWFEEIGKNGKGHSGIFTIAFEKKNT